MPRKSLCSAGDQATFCRACCKSQQNAAPAQAVSKPRMKPSPSHRSSTPPCSCSVCRSRLWCSCIASSYASRERTRMAVEL